MERTSSSEYQPELQAARRRMAHRAPVEYFTDVEAPPPTPISSNGSGSHHADVDMTAIKPVPEHKRVFVDIQRVSAFVPALQLSRPPLLQRLNPMNLRQRVTRAKPTLQILFDVSGCVRPGEVLALMGPSGSGKTTLLSVMGARAQRSLQVQGAVLFDGAPLTKEKKRKVGYVLQDDLLHESLTVHETLYYAAMLRLPRDMPRAEKLARVDSVITALGLKKCSGTIIGGFFRRGISGGERKRVSVGHELLIDPSVLLLDEPTSGLDATTAMHLLQVLNQLARAGRAIVLTLHQPSSRLYQQLDKLLLLSQGHAIYYGQAQEAVDYFKLLGFPIPPRVNAADFLLDLASGEVEAEDQDGETARLHLVACTEAFLAAGNLQDGFDTGRDPAAANTLADILQRVVAGKGPPGRKPPMQTIPSGIELPPSSDGTAKAGRASAEASVLEIAVRSGGDEANGSKVSEGGRGAGLEVEHRWGAPFWLQVRYLVQRSLRTRRFESLSHQDLLQFSIIAVLAGLFWLQKGQENTLLGARNTLGLLFFIIMFLSFRALFVALFTFPEEQRHMLKERASGMYRLSAFYLARTLSDLPMELSIPTGFFIVVYFMGGLQYSAAAFFATYGTVILSMLVAQGLGLLIGAWAMNPKTAQTIASVLMLTLVLVAGFFVTNLPAYISWVRWISYIYYALGLLLYIQFHGRTIYSCVATGTCAQTNPGGDLATNPTCSPVQDLQLSLGTLQDPSSQGDAIRNGLILLAFMVLLRVAVYYVLRAKTARF